MRCILVRDCGGTTCDTLLLRDDGQILGVGHCDVSNPLSGRSPAGSGRSIESVRHSSNQALAGISCDELFVVNGHHNCEEYADVAGRISYVHVMEQDAAFALAGESCGIVVLAGTGAFVHGQTSDGRQLQLDALGPLLGDHGSAYHIGRLALRAVGRADWHPRHKTTLVDAVYAACDALRDGPTNVWNLVDFSLNNPDRAEIAALARIVDAQANAGDEIAIGILKESASSIAETLFDVVDRLGIGGEAYPMIGTGSVAVRSRIYWEHLCSRAAEFAPGLNPVVIRKPAVLGVALAALRTIGIGDQENIRANVLRSAEEKWAH